MNIREWYDRVNINPFDIESYLIGILEFEEFYNELDRYKDKTLSSQDLIQLIDDFCERRCINKPLFLNSIKYLFNLNKHDELNYSLLPIFNNQAWRSVIFRGCTR